MTAGDVWCDVCRRVIEDGRQVRGEVPDSSAVYVYDLGFDGRRFVTACSKEHLTVLRERYDRRPFVDEELWVGKIARVLDENHDALRVDRLAEATGLTVPQVERALEWQNARFARWWNQQCGVPAALSL
ncbi:hypothetical protein ACO0M4_05760 [Streptomyces sp. RGM 3693]|uniref:hypothetical protein n=1 Tax=Streptomyces sp. RGM 3693 TaxID=3413284 RepID=UPI003D28419D